MRSLRIVALIALISVLANACALSQPLHSTAAYPVEDSPGIQDWTMLKDERVVMQQYDYSCGASAMATMLRYYFNDAVSELDILNDVDVLFTNDELQVIRERGLSFLELERLAQNRGYQSVSVELTPEAARSLQGPIIIYLKTPDYQHFAVLRQVINGTAYLADPSRGNVVLPFLQLLEHWHGEALILGKEGFGIPQDFPLRPQVANTESHRLHSTTLRATDSDWSRLPK